MQPTEIRFYRDETGGISATSITYIHPPRDNGVVERTELYVPAEGWFKETINDIQEALVELVEMTAEKAPEDAE